MQLLDKTVNNAFCLSMAGMKMNGLLKAHLSSSHFKSEFSRTLVKHNSLQHRHRKKNQPFIYSSICSLWPER